MRRACRRTLSKSLARRAADTRWQPLLCVRERAPGTLLVTLWWVASLFAKRVMPDMSSKRQARVGSGDGNHCAHKHHFAASQLWLRIASRARAQRYRACVLWCCCVLRATITPADDVVLLAMYL